MPSITDFVANFQKGARSNRYEVTITYPSFIGADGTNLRFYAKAAQIPPATLGTIEVPYLGRIYKIPGDRTFPEWTLTIFNTETFDHRNALEKWSNAMNSHDANERETEAFLGRATVTQLSQTGDRIQTYVFENLWPSEVGAIELAFDNNDTISEFIATFQYSHWQNAETTS